MVPPPSGELDIDALLETARKDPAYRDLSSEELFLQVTQKLYSALKADKERAASGETRPAESNKVLQAKEWIYPDCYEAYICRYKGQELLLRRHPQRPKQVLPTDLTKSWDQSRSSTSKSKGVIQRAWIPSGTRDLQ